MPSGPRGALVAFATRAAVSSSSSPVAIPPPPPFPPSLSSADVSSLTSGVIADLESAVSSIERGSSSSSPPSRWDDGPFGALSSALGRASSSSAALTLPSMTHADPDVRSASTSAKDALKGAFDAAFARPELFGALSEAVATTAAAAADDDGDEDTRLETEMLRRFRRNGCGLEDGAKRAELSEKRAEIERTCSAFCASINDCSAVLTFTEDELDGVPDVARYSAVGEKEGGGVRRKVSLKAPDAMPVLQFCRNADTRKAVAVAMAEKCQSENTPRFLDVVRLRDECASILGAGSHAAFALETTMAATPERVETFLSDLIERFRPLRDRDLDALRQLKEEEEGPSAGPLEPWDAAYYVRAYKATQGVDEAKLREYFPLDHVKGEILSIYEELLGLKFVKVEDAKVWHPDVECYAVLESVTPGDSAGQNLLGYFYLDLFPRDGKYTHQCVYPLGPSFEVQKEDGGIKRVLPMCANIGNLPRGGEDGTPSMLRFREVETFFHEFGHVVHSVLSKSRHSLQSWAWSAVPWPGGVEQDFLEVPSMMLENFVWRPEVLRRLSKRPEDGSCLPEETISALSRSRFVMEGYSRSRYLAMALYDLIIHSGPGPYTYKGKDHDAITLYETVMEDVGGLHSIKGAFPVASWYHLMMGYDAGYFSYIWSEAYAADLFSVFEASPNGVMDPALGRNYRETILQPCATLDGGVMLRNFLGRDPSTDAFLRRMDMTS